MNWSRYDHWKTTPPEEPELLEWSRDYLSESNEYHQCEDCNRFLSHSPHASSFDGECTVFEFRCAHCGSRHDVQVPMDFF